MKNKIFFVSHLNILKMLNDPGAWMLCCSSSSFGPYAWLGYKGIAREFLKTCFEGKWKGVFGYCEHWRDRCKSGILDRGMFCDRQRQPDCHPLPEGFLPNKNASAKNLTKHSCYCLLTLKKRRKSLFVLCIKANMFPFIRGSLLSTSCSSSTDNFPTVQ